MRSLRRCLYELKLNRCRGEEAPEVYSEWPVIGACRILGLPPRRHFLYLPSLRLYPLL